MHATVDIGLGGVGHVDVGFEVASDVHATVDIGLGGVGHVDVGLKLHRMCTLRWT